MKKLFSAVTAVMVLLLVGCQERVGPGAVELKRPEVRGVTLATVGSSPGGFLLRDFRDG